MNTPTTISEKTVKEMMDNMRPVYVATLKVAAEIAKQMLFKEEDRGAAIIAQTLLSDEMSRLSWKGLDTLQLQREAKMIQNKLEGAK